MDGEDPQAGICRLRLVPYCPSLSFASLSDDEKISRYISSLPPFRDYQNQLVLLHCQPAIFFMIHRGLKKIQRLPCFLLGLLVANKSAEVALSSSSFISTSSSALSGLFNMRHPLSKLNDFAVKGLGL